jgi:hypothetical protein
VLHPLRLRRSSRIQHSDCVKNMQACCNRCHKFASNPSSLRVKCAILYL